MTVLTMIVDSRNRPEWPKNTPMEDAALLFGDVAVGTWRSPAASRVSIRCQSRTPKLFLTTGGSESSSGLDAPSIISMLLNLNAAAVLLEIISLGVLALGETNDAKPATLVAVNTARMISTEIGMPFLMTIGFDSQN